MTTIAIVTCTKLGGIGIESKFPWPSLYFDEDNFNETVNGNIVLVGSGAYATHKHLRGSVTYVLTSNTEFETSDTVKAIAGTPEEVITQITSENPGKDIFIAGGETVFRAYDSVINEWYVTVVEERHIFDREIFLNRIKHDFPNHKFLTEGTDNNQNFTRWHFTK